MHVISLNELDVVPARVEADVCIVGAGAAGLYLAHRLKKSLGRVVVVEAGPRKPVSGPEAGISCTFAHDPYGGADEGRAFGLGGTTSRWGGQLVAYAPGDSVRGDAAIGAAWQRILDVSEHHRHAVAMNLGIEEHVGDRESASLPDTKAMVRAAGLAPGLSCWLPFRRRNFSWLVRAARGEQDAVQVYCDAVAAEWRLEQGNDGNCSIRELVARSRSGRSLRICASRFVIAAGTIESTRILHEINSAGADHVIPKSAALGRYLSDHLSFTVGEFDPAARRRVTRMLVPHFSKNCMRTWRFVDDESEAARCRYFAHVVFLTQNPGFQLARLILQGLQAGRMPAVGLRALGRGSLGALKIAWCRWIHSRLYIAANTPCSMQLDMEQRPHASNMICLSRSLDNFGRPDAVVHWRIREQDEIDMARARLDFLLRWSTLGPAVSLRPVPADPDALTKPHDAYHPVGTCRLGEDSAGVVGFDLNARGTENLFVLSTALFPSAGSANPTFTLLCFAEMLAEHLMARR